MFFHENDGKQYADVLQVRNQQKREHMRGKADAAEEEDYATFLQQVLLDVMMTAIYCSISWNRNIFMFLGRRLNCRARIQFRRVHFGVFSTSRFAPPALSSHDPKTSHCQRPN